MFRKVLIANRGEITVRIARACRKMGIVSVAVYSDADREALHVRACDEAYYVGPAPASESYLRTESILAAARHAQADAIHPGYGFLSENADFARAVRDAGIVWIGPTPEAMDLMGSKIGAKRLAEQAGVPTVPGYSGDDQSTLRLVKEAERVGFPVLIKASAGGGGKGMRVANSAEEMGALVEAAQREAMSAFADSALLLERYLQAPRHIEVQVLGDNYGNIIHLGERDCSVQRRHQKVFEESPAPGLTPEMRDGITGAALTLARAANYSNAGTVEFIFENGEYFFLEMNTRLQVEHPVTEEALGLDLVEAQIRIAAGEQLPWTQDRIRFSRHAMEARLYAEDPEHQFLPSTGNITITGAPGENGVRIDAGVASGDTITPYYDPMIAKIITSGSNRAEALSRMQAALGELEITGVKTNLSFLRWLVHEPDFRSARLTTNFIRDNYAFGASPAIPIEVLLAASAQLALQAGFRNSSPLLDVWRGSWRQARQHMVTTCAVENTVFSATFSALEEPHVWSATLHRGEEEIFSGLVRLILPASGESEHFAHVPRHIQVSVGNDNWFKSIKVLSSTRPGELVLEWGDESFTCRVAAPPRTDNINTELDEVGEDTVKSPMPGKVLKILVASGDAVTTEQPLVIIEAMKMEFLVKAPHSGKVAQVHYEEGAQVAAGAVLMELRK